MRGRNLRDARAKHLTPFPNPLWLWEPWGVLMARVSSSQAPADLAELVERLHGGGTAAAADFSQDELETVIDDLPLALESESIRDHLPALVGRIDRRLDRTFRRIIEIARQDEERTGLLLLSLEKLPWRGTPSEDEFAWLVQQMSRNSDAAARLAAFRRAANLTLHQAQVAILDALGSIHPDEAVRSADQSRRAVASSPDAEVPAPTTGELVSSQEAARREDEEAQHPEDPERATGAVPTQWDDPGSTAVSRAPEGDDATTSDDQPITDEPSRDEAVIDESQAPAGTWDKPEEPQPDRLTVRTLLRSLEPAANLAAPKNGADAHPDDEPTIADEDDEPTPHVENSLTGEGEAVAAPAEDEPAAADESSSPEAAAAAAATPDVPRDPITVRTLLASLDTVLLTNAPGEDGAEAAVVEESPETWNESEVPPERVTVMTMLRSLETVRVKMAALEEAPPVTPPAGEDASAAPVATPAAAPLAEAAPAEAPAPEPAAEKRPDKPWTGVDLKPLSPPDRARRLAKVRRALETPELRRDYLGWLLEREKDPFSVVSIRKEILEFAFDRPNFLGFDDATRARLGRWIRERAAADQVAPAALLAALRRATWAEGEPPQVDEKTRAIVDAVTGALSRVPPEERTSLYNRDFTAWLFSIREWEDREVLDRYARDPSPGVSEGLFRALAAMDGLSARFGGTGGQSALEIALGLWDRADNDARGEIAKAISEGWSRGLVLDRRSFFDAFWTRYQQHEAQRPAILVALASFEKEIEEAHAKAAAAAQPASDPAPAPPASARSARDAAEVTKPNVRMPDPTPPPTERAKTNKPAFAAPPAEEPSASASAPAPAEPASTPFAEGETEEGTDRFFRMMRKNMEVGMRASVEPGPAEDENLDDAPVPEEGDAVDSVIPDEGDAVLESAPEPAPQTAATSSGDPRDEEVVLPHEALRSLSEYTQFLKALSAGRPIDELLTSHGMDYKQYAGCMTAWGRLLQNRPDLALRMGQLLRAPA